MDWQLIEVATVTVLALWVLLFAGNSFSRLAAGAMLLLNLLWIIFEREKPPSSGPKPADGAGGTVPGEEPPAELRASDPQGEAPSGPPGRRKPRVL